MEISKRFPSEETRRALVKAGLPREKHSLEEVLDELPQILKIKGKTYQLFMSMGLDRQYFIVYANELDYNDNAPFPIKMTHSLAEAAAKMYLYLAEKGLLK